MEFTIVDLTRGGTPELRALAEEIAGDEDAVFVLDCPVVLDASGCRVGTGTGGEARTPHGESPFGPIFYTPCAPGRCDICDGRRDQQWRYMQDDL